MNNQIISLNNRVLFDEEDFPCDPSIDQINKTHYQLPISAKIDE